MSQAWIESNRAAPASSPSTSRALRGAGLVRRSLAGLARSVPTAAVLLLLASIAYFGHHTGWKMPKFSALVGREEAQEEGWCAEHNVPESECIACHAELMPKGKAYGWCKEHGVHECPLCHPEVAQLQKTPELSDSDRARAARGLALTNRPENDNRCKLHLRRIQFPSAEAVQKAGIDVAVVDQMPITEAVSATGEIAYDDTRVARLSARAAGTVWRVEKQVGDHVRTGEVLALVDAVEVGRAKGELLHALAEERLQRKAFDRASQLTQKGIVPTSKTQETETALAQARTRMLSARQALVNLGLPARIDELREGSDEEIADRLRFLGLPETVVAQLDADSTPGTLLPIRSSLDGVVVAREVVPGEVVDTSKVLFTLADTSSMWLLLAVRLEDARYVASGQPVRFRPDGTKEVLNATMNWISTAADPETRQVKVRAELGNTDGRLRAETFGAGQIVLREENDAIVVPNEAVHWEGSCHVVFVRDKDFLKEGSYKVFHTRTVRPGVTNERTTEILAGLLPGEVVASKGSGMLRAELLKGNLGAG